MAPSIERAAVTVLLPVFNGMPHLVEAVESILGQTHDVLELLVIDDGSEDGTGEYLDGLSDQRVRVIHQENRGLVATLNRGLAEAAHPLVARMDADDVSVPKRLAVQLAYLAEHPDVVAVGSCFTVIDGSGRRITDEHVAAEPGYFLRSMYARNRLAHGSVVMRRGPVLEAGGYRDVGPCEDYELWTRLLVRNAVANVPDVLYRHRMAQSGISWMSRERQSACFDAVRAELHRSRPLPTVGPLVVMSEGLAQVRRYGGCRGNAQVYANDHWLLAKILLRSGRGRAAGSLLLGLFLFVARVPRAAVGLPPLTQAAGLRRKWLDRRRA